MFVTTPNNQVIAIDAKTGNLLWRYRRPRAPAIVVPHETNRGVALYGDKVYFAAGEAVLVALDARTGREVWTHDVGGQRVGYYMTLAPLVADGRSWLVHRVASSAFAASSPPSISRPARSAGAPTPCRRPASRAARRGRKAITGRLAAAGLGDRQLRSRDEPRLLGHGQRWPEDWRSTSRRQPLFTSTVALDVATGEIKGYHQYHPNDSWDWDEVSPPILVDYRRNGRTIKGLIDVARDGYIWFLERSDGPIRFVDGKPFVLQNVFRGVDPKSGRPDVDPDAKPGTGKRADFCPVALGGKNWPPIAFSPPTRMIYIPANNNLCGTNIGHQPQYTPGRPFVGVGGSRHSSPRRRSRRRGAGVERGHREEGVDAQLQEVAELGPMLVTARRCRLYRRHERSHVSRVRRANGKLLWEFPTNSGMLAPPHRSSIDGRSTSPSRRDGACDSRGMQATLNSLFPGEFPEVPEGGAVWVFALE